jgi:quinolinate synthase
MRINEPNKVFIPAPANNACACNDCPHMKLNTLEKVWMALKYEQPEIQMDESLRVKALAPILKMLELSI